MAGSSRQLVLYNSDIFATSYGMSEPIALTGAGNPFGWAPPAGGSGKLVRLPERVTPRHVVGVTAGGKIRRAIVADLAADLWTGVATQWTDTVGDVCTVTGYVGEKASARTF